MTRLLAVIFLAFCLSNPAMAGVANRYGKNKHSVDPNDAENFISAYRTQNQAEAAAQNADQQAINDQLMQATMQSVIGKLTPQDLETLAACMQNHVSADTANRVAAKTAPGAKGSFAASQEFMASPEGQAVIQNCSAEIQALLPTVQQSNPENGDFSAKSRIHSKSR